MKNQVKKTYASGWKITFPKHSNGPMLFMEWLQDSQPKFVSKIDFKIKTVTCESEVLDDLFEVRLSGSAELVDSCFDYIKSNI